MATVDTNKHIGSRLEDFLAEEGMADEVHALAAKKLNAQECPPGGDEPLAPADDES